MSTRVYSFEPVCPRDEGHELALDGEWDVAVADRPWMDKPWRLEWATWRRVILPDGLQDALCRAGVIPNPWYSQNWRQTEWVTRTDWWFKKMFTVPAGWRGKRIRLTFDSLDYYGRVWLNGQALGFHEGAYGGPTFEVSGCLRHGEPNELLVRAGQSRDERETSPVMKPSTLRKGAPASWCSRHASVGILSSVRLVATEPSFLECPFIQTKSLQPDRAKLWVQCHIHNLGEEYSGSIELKIESWPDGQPAFTALFQQRMPSGTSMLEQEMELTSPRLWWPNGLGAQNLYRARFTLRRDDQQVADEIVLRFGVRTLELVRNPSDPENPRRLNSPIAFESDGTVSKPVWRGFADGDQGVPDAGGLLNPYGRTLASDIANSQGDANYRFCFRVNGKEFYAGGAAWLPTDTMSNLPERYRWFLQLAKESNLRLLRINGGAAPFERDLFYGLCDELGILVWQEAPAGSPPPYQKRLDVWREQITQNVLRLRSHPCLALWVGGNEFDPYEEAFLAIMGLTREICAQLDPDRPFRPNSPGGGTKHAYGPPGLYQAEENWYLRHYGTDCNFVSEWSCSSMLSDAAYRRIANERELDDRPVGYDWEAFFIGHPDLMDHWSEAFSFTPETALLKGTPYGDFSKATLARVAEYAQMGQAHTFGYVTENWRALFPYHGGETVWTLSSVSPCNSWQTVDWFGAPNIAYYFRKRAYAPLHVLARLPCFSWYVGETFSAELMAVGEGEGRALTLVARILDARLNEAMAREFPVTLPGNGRPSAPVDLRWKIPATALDTYFFLELTLVDRDGGVVARNAYWPRVTSRLADEEVRKRYRASVQPMPVWDKGPWLEPQLAACPTVLQVESASAGASVTGAVVCSGNGSAVTPRPTSLSEGRAKPPAELLAVARDNHGIIHTAFVICNTGSKPAFPVRISARNPDVALLCSENYFWLRPGEKRAIEVSVMADTTKINPCFPASAAHEVALSISAWNAAEQTICMEVS